MSPLLSGRPVRLKFILAYLYDGERDVDIRKYDLLITSHNYEVK